MCFLFGEFWQCGLLKTGVFGLNSNFSTLRLEKFRTSMKNINKMGIFCHNTPFEKKLSPKKQGFWTRFARFIASAPIGRQTAA
jgi:hypothetical protein